MAAKMSSPYLSFVHQVAERECDGGGRRGGADKVTVAEHGAALHAEGVRELSRQGGGYKTVSSDYLEASIISTHDEALAEDGDKDGLRKAWHHCVVDVEEACAPQRQAHAQFQERLSEAGHCGGRITTQLLPGLSEDGCPVASTSDALRGQFLPIIKALA